jgi:hypothetical protein
MDVVNVETSVPGVRDIKAPQTAPVFEPALNRPAFNASRHRCANRAPVP